MTFNGGNPVRADFSCRERTYHIEYFLCVSGDPLLWRDISVAETQYGERLTANEDLVGVELLPIAKLTGDDLLCLDFRKPKTEPPVCVWSYDESGEFDPVTYEAAKSFEDFISRLHLPLTIKDNIVSIKGCRDVRFCGPIEKIVPFADSFAVLVMGDAIRYDNVYGADYNGNILWNIADITTFKHRQGYVDIGRHDDRTFAAQAFSGAKVLIDMERKTVVGVESTK